VSRLATFTINLAGECEAWAGNETKLEMTRVWRQATFACAENAGRSKEFGWRHLSHQTRNALTTQKCDRRTASSHCLAIATQITLDSLQFHSKRNVNPRFLNYLIAPLSVSSLHFVTRLLTSAAQIHIRYIQNRISHKRSSRFPHIYSREAVGTPLPGELPFIRNPRLW